LYRQLFAKSRARRGIVVRIRRGTELRIKLFKISGAGRRASVEPVENQSR
jgi:hypothetical protein